MLSSRSLSELEGGQIHLKAENLQRTGSFKLRGVLARLAGKLPSAGVTAGSAGNHAQALAYAARAKGVPCQVFTPAGTAVAKVAAVRSFGGKVVLGAESVDAAVAEAKSSAGDTGALFVHPFDDPHIIGIQASSPIADGIAIKHLGELDQALIDQWVDEVVSVKDDDIAEAMVFLAERAKLVVEGAGAVGVAALLAGQITPPEKVATVFVLSGGNVDSGMLASITSRHEATAGRRLRLFTKVPDRPGGLAELLSTVADAGANIGHVEHIRESPDLGVRDTGVLLSLETRGKDHSDEIVAALAKAGYDSHVDD